MNGETRETAISCEHDYFHWWTTPTGLWWYNNDDGEANCAGLTQAVRARLAELIARELSPNNKAKLARLLLGGK